MKKYTNIKNRLGVVRFEDGTSQFLMRGQSIETDKKVKQMDESIRVSEKSSPKKRQQKTETDSEE